MVPAVTIRMVMTVVSVVTEVIIWLVVTEGIMVTFWLVNHLLAPSGFQDI